MNVSKRVANNEKVQNIKNYYQYGNLMFLEAVLVIVEMHQRGELAADEAERAIKQISRIKLPY